MRPATRSVALLFLLLSACAGATGLESRPQTRSDPNRLTREELLAREARNVYDVVRQLRPNWLRTRGQTSFGAPQPVVVYINGVRMGGPENLERLSVDAVQTIEFIDALTANQRFGIDHTNGAILVATQ